jgi:hypothetical protein
MKNATLTECSSLRNHHVSPLLQLPTELRYRIYEYALSDWKINVDYHSFQRKKSSHGPSTLCKSLTNDKSGWLPASRSILALSSVSRQVHAETHTLLFTARCHNELWTSLRSAPELYRRLNKQQRGDVKQLGLRLPDPQKSCIGYWWGTTCGPAYYLRSFVQLEHVIIDKRLCTEKEAIRLAAEMGKKGIQVVVELITVPAPLRGDAII